MEEVGLKDSIGTNYDHTKISPETLTLKFKTVGCKMQAYLEWHNQVDGIVYMNICAEYRFEDPRSKWMNGLTLIQMTELGSCGTFRIPTNKMVVVIQLDIYFASHLLWGCHKLSFDFHLPVRS